VSAHAAGGFSLTTAAGRLNVRPLHVNRAASAATLVAGGGAALFANTAPSTDTVVRPDAAGVDTFVSLRAPSAAASLAWRVSLPGAERLYPLAKGAVGVLAPAPPGGDAATSPALPAGTRVVAILTAPAATDAAGRPVPASLAADGDTVTLHVAPPSTAAYPVMAHPAWMPEGDVGGGWWAYGAAEPLAGRRYALEGRRTGDGYCAYPDSVTLDSGEAQVTRQLAVKAGSCLSLVETGAPYAMPPDDVEGAASAAAAVHKNQGTYKNDQEDPAQIDVNAVSDTIRWSYTSHCVRSGRAWPHTHEYHLTGWKRVGYNDLALDRRCVAATKSTYARFKGGQFFPACFGGSVTTFYANNIAQALPRGRFRGFVYRKTGGAPCYHLLHWETHTWNRRVG
jgi:hypothetical protein